MLLGNEFDELNVVAPDEVARYEAAIAKEHEPKEVVLLINLAELKIIWAFSESRASAFSPSLARSTARMR